MNRYQRRINKKVGELKKRTIYLITKESSFYKIRKKARRLEKAYKEFNKLFKQ